MLNVYLKVLRHDAARTGNRKSKPLDRDKTPWHSKSVCAAGTPPHHPLLSNHESQKSV